MGYVFNHALGRRAEDWLCRPLNTRLTPCCQGSQSPIENLRAVGQPPKQTGQKRLCVDTLRTISRPICSPFAASVKRFLWGIAYSMDALSHNDSMGEVIILDDRRGRDNRKPGHLFWKKLQEAFEPGGPAGTAYATKFNAISKAVSRIISWLRKNPGHSGKLGRMPRRIWDRLWSEVPKSSRDGYLCLLGRHGFFVRTRVYHDPFIEVAHWNTEVEQAHLSRVREQRNARERGRRALLAFAKNIEFGDAISSEGTLGGHTGHISDPRRHKTPKRAKRCDGAAAKGEALEGAGDQHSSSSDFLSQSSSSSDSGEQPMSGAAAIPAKDVLCSRKKEPTGPRVSRTMATILQFASKTSGLDSKHLMTADADEPSQAVEAPRNEPASQPHAQTPAEIVPLERDVRSTYHDPMRDVIVPLSYLQNLLGGWMDISKIDYHAFVKAKVSHWAVMTAWSGMQGKLGSSECRHPIGMLYRGAVAYQTQAWRVRGAA